MLNPPRITVCIPHRNGWPALQATLAGLARQEYPRERWQTVLVDNGSTDDSIARAAAEFPEVTVLRAGGNVGFGAGCNFGVRSGLAPEVCAFLNSDAIPDSDWLSRGAAAFADERVGCVGGKTLFQHRRWGLAFEVPEGAALKLQRLVFAGVRHDARRLTIDEAAEIEDSPELAWQIGNGSVLRFALLRDDAVNASCRFDLVNPNSQPVRGSFSCGAGVREFELDPGETRGFCCEITSDVLQDVVQNAGSFARTNGDCGDVGFGEVDHGQFDSPGEAEALCGVALFVRWSVFEQLGGFDPRYFLYFEDTDLSLRARSGGWKLWYEPRAVVRHLHAGSSVAGSPLFSYHVTRSHLLFCSKFAEPRAWRRVLGGHIRQAVLEFAAFALRPTLRYKNSLRALGSLTREIGWMRLLRERRRFRRAWQQQAQGGQ